MQSELVSTAEGRTQRGGSTGEQPLADGRGVRLRPGPPAAGGVSTPRAGPRATQRRPAGPQSKISRPAPGLLSQSWRTVSSTRILLCFGLSSLLPSPKLTLTPQHFVTKLFFCFVSNHPSWFPECDSIFLERETIHEITVVLLSWNCVSRRASSLSCKSSFSLA